LIHKCAQEVPDLVQGGSTFEKLLEVYRANEDLNYLEQMPRIEREQYQNKVEFRLKQIETYYQILTAKGRVVARNADNTPRLEEHHQKSIGKITFPEGEIEVVLSGRIDRLEQGETSETNQLYIVDWKTGKTKWKPDEKLGVLGMSNLQLYAYQMMLDQEVEGASLVYLGLPMTGDSPKSKSSIVEQNNSAEDLANISSELLSFIENLLSGSSYPATGGDWCRFCDSKNVCPIKAEGIKLKREVADNG
jgi:ATP-dependent helicase/DNAse subunit B